MMRETTKHARWRDMREAILLYVFVAIGTSIGGTARALVSMAAIQLAGPSFPWGTLIVNVVAWLLAVWIGHSLAAQFNRLGGS